MIEHKKLYYQDLAVKTSKSLVFPVEHAHRPTHFSELSS